jgi:hypothetical protein
MSTYVPGQAIPIKALLLVRARRGQRRAHYHPPNSMVGAMLWAGYLGNVVVTHLN